MMIKKEISLDERKLLQLDMLQEIDAFCKMNGIQYSLIFGTLLGAIRHKGYIPWDDDVDITMPLEDMLRFKKNFKSDKLEYVDLDIKKDYQYVLSRIVYKPTFSKLGFFSRADGISIDLYPVIEITNDDKEAQMLFDEGLKYERIHHDWWIWNGRFRKIFPFSLPMMRQSTKILRDYYFNRIQKHNGGRFFFVAGSMINWKEKTLDFNPFSEMITIPFENISLQIPKAYDIILHTIYGDYMELPPEDQRHPYHMGKYYWK